MGAAEAAPAEGAPKRDALRIVSTVLLGLAVVFAAMSTYWVYKIGHSGSKAVWHDTKIVGSVGGDD